MTEQLTPGRVMAGTLKLESAGSRITLYGWVHKQRDFGELIFVDLRDRSGIVQIVFDQNRLVNASAIDSAKELRSEWVVRIEGEVVARDDDRRNPKMPTGDIEVIATAVEILAQSDTPPFAIEDQPTASEETRLRHRYLDLRRAPLTANLILRDRVCHTVRDFMHREGFLEIETPVLTRSTPEGARDYLVPSRVNRGSFYALPQSPQLFKQLLMVSGLERYYQIAKCFRDEDLRSDRQPEFTQIDVEASFIDEEFVYSLIERLFSEVFPLAGIPVMTPFPRITWQESMDHFGTDRPDTRFGMELQELAHVARKTAFAPFQQALDDGGMVRGIVVPGAASYSRKQLDDLGEFAKKFGAGGLVWMKFDGQGGSSIRKFLDDSSFEALRAALGAHDGDLGLIVSGRPSVVYDVLGNLRLRLARELNLIPKETWNFVWVVDFPVYEYDQESNRFFARHHPFTSPAASSEPTFDTDQASAKARAYDIVLNGLEVGGGSIRINRPEIQQRMFRALEISEDEARERFGFLLDAFRYGAPPHGGIALGLDRMIMLMARAQSIRDVIAFPKTTTGQDLMTQAPSVVDEKQLGELGLRLSGKE